jgi:hypothetical protein
VVVEGKAKRQSKASKIGIGADQLAVLISTATGGIAEARGKDYWVRSPDECSILAEPLAQYLETLPAKQAVNISKVLLPFSIMMATITLFGEPVKREIEEYHEQQNIKQATRRQAIAEGGRRVTQESSNPSNPESGGEFFTPRD